MFNDTGVLTGDSGSCVDSWLGLLASWRVASVDVDMARELEGASEVARYGELIRETSRLQFDQRVLLVPYLAATAMMIKYSYNTRRNGASVTV